MNEENIANRLAKIRELVTDQLKYGRNEIALQKHDIQFVLTLAEINERERKLLQKEALLLADWLDEHCGQSTDFCIMRCPMFIDRVTWCNFESSPSAWLELARKAIQDAENAHAKTI